MLSRIESPHYDLRSPSRGFIGRVFSQEQSKHVTELTLWGGISKQERCLHEANFEGLTTINLHRATTLDGVGTSGDIFRRARNVKTVSLYATDPVLLWEARGVDTVIIEGHPSHDMSLHWSGPAFEVLRRNLLESFPDRFKTVVLRGRRIKRFYEGETPKAGSVEHQIYRALHRCNTILEDE